MKVSMYQASVPVFIRMLGNLSAILDKASAHAVEHKIDPAVLLSTRLYPDMFPLLKQVQIATDHARGAPARLGGLEVPMFEDTDNTFADLKARIDKSIAYLKTLSPGQIDGSDEKAIELVTRTHTLNFKGAEYLLNYAMPNFYFHVTTTYAILRHCGIAIGKRDFIGPA
jgi:hypothetical protein